MLNLINLIISFFMGDFIPIGLVLPMGIMKFFKKDNNQSLPEAYLGVRDGNLNKDEYIKEQVDQVDQTSVIEGTVDQVTRQAEDQWNYDNPYFREIQRLIIDSDYCGLVGVYRRDGLNYPKAFWNVFNIFIKNNGDLNKGVYSMNVTIGEFIHDLIQEFGFDRYNSEVASMIDACKELRDDHGILFNTEQQPSAVTTETTANENEDDYVDIDYPIDDDEDIDIIPMDSDDEDDDDDELEEMSPVDNTAPFYRTTLKSEESTLLKEFDKVVSPTSTVMDDDMEVISPVTEIDIDISSSPTKEEPKQYSHRDPSTWNEKQMTNARWCEGHLPTCSTCGGDRIGRPPRNVETIKKIYN